MFASPHAAVKAYASVGMQTDIATGNPHKLTLMLFEGASLALAKARLHMQRKEISAKGEAISKAISIIDQGLKASLDVKAGGKMAEKLYALYEYMSHRLLVANLENRVELLDEVAGLLAGLCDAWKSISQNGQPAAAPAIATAAPRLQQAYGKV